MINGNMDVSAALADLETQLEAMGMWELIGLWLETNIINLCMWVLSIVIFVIVYENAAPCSCVQRKAAKAQGTAGRIQASMRTMLQQKVFGVYLCR